MTTTATGGCRLFADTIIITIVKHIFHMALDCVAPSFNPPSSEELLHGWSRVEEQGSYGGVSCVYVPCFGHVVG